MEAEADDEPATRLFNQAIVVVARVEEVVGLNVKFPGAHLPSQTCIGQAVGAVVADVAVEVGVAAYAILPSDHHAKLQSSGQLQSEVANELMAQVFEGVLRHDIRFLFLVLVDIAIAEFKILQHMLVG